jgi:RNAse (barnase) inhibitor barstar
MRVIRLDAHRWAGVGDFHTDLMAALEAPDWHGESMNALIDSMIHGYINGVEPPYRIEIEHAQDMALDVEAWVAQVAWVMAKLTPWADGEPQVSIVPARG